MADLQKPLGIPAEYRWMIGNLRLWRTPAWFDRHARSAAFSTLRRIGAIGLLEY